MQKAIRDAKAYTSRLNPSQPHERAMTRFVQVTLAHVGFQPRRSR